MSETTTLARPYARAVFELAREQGQYSAWSEMLRLAALVASDRQVATLLQSPQLSKTKRGEILLGICGDRFSAAGQNFIRLLAENSRLGSLPEIVALYEAYRAEAEGTLEAQVISAQAIEQAKLQQIASSLSKRLGRKVNLQTKIDESLIGGAVIHAGDLVIDGSVRGQLGKLAGALVH